MGIVDGAVGRLRIWQIALVVVMYASHACLLINRRDVAIVLPTMRNDSTISVTKNDAGFILAAGNVANLVGELFAGFIVDKIGGRAMFTVGCIMCGVCTILFSLFRSLPAWLVTWIFNRVFQSGVNPSVTSIISRWFVDAEYGRAVGILVSSTRVGAALAGIILGSLLLILGWQQVLLVAGLAMFSFGVIGAFLLRQSPEDVGLSLTLLTDQKTEIMTPAAIELIEKVSIELADFKAMEINDTELNPTSVALVTSPTENMDDGSAVFSRASIEPVASDAELVQIRESSVVSPPLQASSPSLSELCVIPSESSPVTSSPTPFLQSSLPPPPSLAVQAIAVSAADIPSISQLPSSQIISNRPEGILPALKMFVTEPRFWLMCFMTSLTWLMFVFDTYLSLFFTDALGVNPADAGIASACFPAGMVISLIVGGFVIDKLTRFKSYILIWCSYLLTTVAMSIIFALVVTDNVNSFPLIVVLSFFAGVGLSLPAYFIQNQFALRYGGPQHCGKLVAIWDVFGWSAMAAFDFSFGTLTAVSWDPVFILLTVSCVVALVVMFAFFYMDLRVYNLEQLSMGNPVVEDGGTA